MGIVQLPFPPENTPKRVLGRSHRKTRLSAEVWFANRLCAPLPHLAHVWREVSKPTDLSFRCKDGPGMLYLGQGPVVCEGVCRQASSGRRFATCHGRSSMRYL